MIYSMKVFKAYLKEIFSMVFVWAILAVGVLNVLLWITNPQNYTTFAEKWIALLPFTMVLTTLPLNYHVYCKYDLKEVK